MSNDIVSLVGDLIIHSQQKKQARYDACGCSSCQARANKIETWLNPKSVILVPDETSDRPYHQKRATLSTQQVWLCHSCLRKASAPTGRCPYCGTERYVAR